VSAFADRAEYGALRGLMALLVILPEAGSRWICRRFGDLLFDLVRLRRRVALSNLRASFPERSEEEIRGIARRCYRGYAETVGEFARLPRWTAGEVLERSEVVGAEHIDAVVGRGKGVILLTGHFGNWEWLGPLITAMGHRMSVVVGEQHNRLVDGFINRTRAQLGVGVLSAERDLRGIVQALDRRGIVAMVADQDAGRDGIFVDFLGRAASTAVGPVRLARRFDVPIVMGFAIRMPGGRLRFELTPPIRVPSEGEVGEVERTYTEAWSRRLEEYVRTYPDHWFWMHRRWKTRPETARNRMKGVAG
jgi:Kdo2-lipid IVA lauroyltransferase/acyltransferase